MSDHHTIIDQIRNNEINYLELDKISLGTNNYNKLLELIKNNTSIQCIETKYGIVCGIYGQFLSDLLKVNKTINKIIISSYITINGLNHIMRALEYNACVVKFGPNAYIHTLFPNAKLNEYNKRNIHNMLLKNMMIQDL
jgi:hypothetical protein